MTHFIVALGVVAMAAAPMPADGKAAKPGVKRPAKKCSAAGLAVRSMLPLKLPKKVLATREAILQAAVHCDIPKLEKIALSSGRRFDFSFGAETRPSVEWQRREKAGHQILLKLVKILRLQAGQEGTKWVWPSAFREDATEEDWENLVHLFGDREITLFKNHTGYTGPRTAINGDGTWLYFVDGD